MHVLRRSHAGGCSCGAHRQRRPCTPGGSGYCRIRAFMPPVLATLLLQESIEVNMPDAFVLQNKKLLKVNMAASGGQVLDKERGHDAPTRDR